MKRSSQPVEVYRARVNVFHRPTDAVIPAGEAVDVSHLGPDEIELLVEKGALERLTVVQEAPLRKAEAERLTAEENS